MRYLVISDIHGDLTGAEIIQQAAETHPAGQDPMLRRYSLPWAAAMTCLPITTPKESHSYHEFLYRQNHCGQRKLRSRSRSDVLNFPLHGRLQRDTDGHP